ncbi:MAG: etfB [Gammaproteobacteria bacterium]|jgi:electron transfer flavoprotein beta subunit|nr:etfB [Gammaproteobacteria bacterium]
MKILVTVKRVMDYAVPIRLKEDYSGVDTAHVKMSMNPFDEIAVEEAVRLKEHGIAQEVVAISIGMLECQDTLRTALAMGADRAILVESALEIQPLAAAKILKVLALRESPQLIILGKQAIDSDHNQTGQMLAGLLNWSQGTFVSKVLVEKEKVEVIREIDGGLETLALQLPAVITADLRLNKPRYLSLPHIMQAKQKPLQIIPAEEFQLDLQPRLQRIKVTTPQKKRAGIKVVNIKELWARLKNEARVL